MPAVPFLLADALAFAHLERLWLLLALPALAILFVWAERRSARRLSGLASPRLRGQLLRGASPGRRRVRFGLMLGALGFLVVALARPQWGFDRREVKRRGLDIILAFDVSKSMLANDLEPTRLARAKLAAQDLLALCQGDRVGLVAFAGRAFLMAPLTIDHGAVLNSLAELDTDIIPRGGTNLAEAIDLSLEAFGKGEGSDRAIIFLTDGEELEADVLVKTRAAREANVHVFCIGVGSAEGSLIPLPGGAFVRDRSGQMVRSRLDEDRLRQVASAGGGTYVRLGSGPRVIEDLWRDGLAKLQAGEKETQTTMRAVDRFQWAIGAGVFFLAASLLVSERRRERVTSPSTSPKPALHAAVASVLLVASILSSPIYAASAAREGIRQYNDGRFPDAARTFDELARRNPDAARFQFNLGAAAYKAGEYGRAVEAFGRVLGAEDPTLLPQAYYNLGNSLFRQGEKQKEPAARMRDWENALGHYDSALRLHPDDPDARANRALVVRALEEEKKKQPPPPSKDSSPDAQQPDQGDGQKPPDQQQPPSDPKSGKDGSKPPRGEGQQDSPPKDEKQEKKDGSSGEGQDQNQGESGEQPPQSGDQKQEGDEKEGEDKKPSNSSRPDNKSGGQGDKGQPPPQMGEGPQGDVQAREPQTAESKEQPTKPGNRPEGETKDGRLSTAQARALLDALKGEDDRVLFNDRNKRQEPVYKDW